MDDLDDPLVVSAQTISECASLLPPLSPQPPTAVDVTNCQELLDPSNVLPGSGNVTLLVPMNGPILPKPGEKVFIDNVPQFSSNGSTVFLLPKPGVSSVCKEAVSGNSVSKSASDGIKLLIPVKGPSKHRETIFIKNAPNPGGPVFLIPSQTDPNEKVLVPATSHQGRNSGAIILVPQAKTKSSKQSSQPSAQGCPKTKKQRRNKAATDKEKTVTSITTRKKIPESLQSRAAVNEINLSQKTSQTEGQSATPNQNMKDGSGKLNGPTIATKNGRKGVGKKASTARESGKPSATNVKNSVKPTPVTKSICLPATQRHPLILGDRARQMYEKNVNELKTVIRTQRRKIQKQQRDLDRLRQEKKEGVKYLPKKHLCKLIRKHLPGYVGQFIEAQLINYGVEVKNKHRWEMSDKVFALALWHRSPLAYKLLRETFAMPSVKTLQHWTATVPADLDFYDVLKELVRKKLPQDEDEENEDEMSEKSRMTNGEIDSCGVNNGSDNSDTEVESEANDVHNNS